MVYAHLDSGWHSKPPVSAVARGWWTGIILPEARNLCWGAGSVCPGYSHMSPPKPIITPSPHFSPLCLLRSLPSNPPSPRATGFVTLIIPQLRNSDDPLALQIPSVVGRLALNIRASSLGIHPRHHTLLVPKSPPSSWPLLAFQIRDPNMSPWTFPAPLQN